MNHGAADFQSGTRQVASVGFKAIDNKAMKFLVDAGAGGVWEKNPVGDVRTSGAVTAGERLSRQLSPTASIKHAAAALWKADDFADGLYTLSVGLATKVSDRAQLSIDLLDTFKNKPATAATKKSDVAIVMAIAAKF